MSDATDSSMIWIWERDQINEGQFGSVCPDLQLDILFAAGHATSESVSKLYVILPARTGEHVSHQMSVCVQVDITALHVRMVSNQARL